MIELTHHFSLVWDIYWLLSHTRSVQQFRDMRAIMSGKSIRISAGISNRF